MLHVHINCLKTGRKIKGHMSIISISEAILRLKADKVVGLPTETVYGLAGSISSQVALETIFKTKDRPFFDPLIIHVSCLEQLKSLTSIYPEDIIKKLFKAFWPGPLTIVLPKSDQVSDLITSGLNTVAIRIPDHPLFLEAASEVGPLAAPSANKFGKTSPTKASHVVDEFGGNIGVVDGGDCEVGIESTILSIEKGNFKILRPGLITKSEIAKVLGVGKDKIISSHSGDNAPGQLKYHYQPEVPLALTDNAKDIATDLLKLTDKKITNYKVLELSDNPLIFARTMYAQFREESKNPYDLLVIEKNKSTEGVWASIENRLQRAATWDLRH